MNHPFIGFGQVWHARLKPVAHAFAYPTLFLMLPMRTLAAVPGASGALAYNRRGALSFHTTDHGDGRQNPLEWLDELLAEAGIADATGEAWLHCYPRVLGYTFKPVSFWYCHGTDGALRAVVVEVNNTFGERHCYVLDRPAWGQEIAASKAFYVSPFCRVEGRYRFRFMLSFHEARTLVRIDHDDAEGPLLRTSVGGQLRPATRRALLGAVFRYPLLTFGIFARIRWQAFRLWLARVPFIPHRPLPRR